MNVRRKPELELQDPKPSILTSSSFAFLEPGERLAFIQEVDHLVNLGKAEWFFHPAHHGMNPKNRFRLLPPNNAEWVIKSSAAYRLS